MPIITVQRRMAEQGRIRLGHKVTGTTKAGKEYTRPAKLDRFRFTSPSERLIEEIAAKYGGEPRPWDNDGKAEFEVISNAVSIPVIVVKGGFSQWHEHVTKAGVQHRCDGEKDRLGEYCDPQDPNHLAAIEKPTTRLSVMLSEIQSLGTWLLVSKGWNAAAELPSMAELAMHVGDLVPATLGLTERSSVIQTDKGPQTSRYVVPFLDLHVTKQRLVEIVGGPGGTPTLEPSASSTPALEAPKAPTEQLTGQQQVKIPTPEQIAGFDLDTARKALAYLDKFAPEHPARDAVYDRVADLEPSPDADGAYEAEVVEDPPTASAAAADEGDADAVWQRIVTVAAEHGLGNLADLQDDFAQRMGGVTADSATAAELTHYLGLLTGEGAAA